MNNRKTITRLFYLTSLAGLIITQLSCGDKVTDDPGGIEIFGRIVYWANYDSSSAEFYVYNNYNAVSDAIIILENDTIPHSASGYYFSPLSINIGDAVTYSIGINSELFEGYVIVPDTASILIPEDYDTIFYNSDFTVEWQRTSTADGYYVYLEEQDGFVAAVVESHFDTSAVLPGENYLFSGLDRLWLESLNGAFESGITPGGRIMPQGIVASSANFRDVRVY